MGYGSRDIDRMEERHTERATKQVEEVMRRVEEGMHEKMSPRYHDGVRESLSTDVHPNPLAVALCFDGTGSMGHVPRRFTKTDLHGFLKCMIKLAAAGSLDPQVLMAAVCDYDDSAPLQIGHFESSDELVDKWLTSIWLPGGGGGSESMHEAYDLFLYFLARKAACHSWQTGKKGYAFLVGDEMCNRSLATRQIRRVFGDEVEQDIPIADLIAEVRKKWHAFFLYVPNGAYGDAAIETIWQSWQEVLGENALRLDREGHAVIQMSSAIIGMTEGVFTAREAVLDMTELGEADEGICRVVAAGLGVDWQSVEKEHGVGRNKAGGTQKKPRRGPKKL